MKAEIIAVGTEILTGQIVNTNAQFLSEKLASLGIDVYYHVAVGDNEGRLFSTIETASKRSDLVILCGGLGPTEDDLTKQTLAKFLGKELVFDPTALAKLDTFFASRPDYVRTPNNERQAQLIAGSIPLQNRTGLAVGGLIEVDGVTYVVLPGPPSELKPMVNEQLVPHLTTGEQLFSRVLRFFGIGESQLVTILADIIEKQSDPTVAPYAKTGEVHIRVTASGEDTKAAGKAIKPVVKELKSRFGADIYSTKAETTLEMAVADLLMANDLTVTTAESCTGGMIAARIINVPGVSECYKAGLVTYSNKAKRKFLGVRKSTLDKYGAVSSKTASEMAKGAALLMKSDVAVAVTGIAGPDGGTEEKPVGLVYIGCSIKGEVTVKEYHFSGTRSQIREATTSAALILMRSCILKYFSKVTFGKK